MAVCGCLWLFMAVCVCLWRFVAVYGCFWLFMAVRGCSTAVCMWPPSAPRHKMYSAPNTMYTAV
eukprot:10027569-Prorocentrum_lima.AAC.1